MIEGRAPPLIARNETQTHTPGKGEEIEFGKVVRVSPGRRMEGTLAPCDEREKRAKVIH
jgi:hypothetical protein